MKHATPLQHTTRGRHISDNTQQVWITGRLLAPEELHHLVLGHLVIRRQRRLRHAGWLSGTPEAVRDAGWLSGIPGNSGGNATCFCCVQDCGSTPISPTGIAREQETQVKRDCHASLGPGTPRNPGSTCVGQCWTVIGWSWTVVGRPPLQDQIEWHPMNTGPRDTPDTSELHRFWTCPANNYTGIPLRTRIRQPHTPSLPVTGGPGIRNTCANETRSDTGKSPLLPEHHNTCPTRAPGHTPALQRAGLITGNT